MRAGLYAPGYPAATLANRHTCNQLVTAWQGRNMCREHKASIYGLP